MRSTIPYSPFSIANAPDLLCFDPVNAPSFQPLVDDFHSMCRTRFHAILDRAAKESASAVQELNTKIALFSEEEFMQILTMPAFLNRIYRNPKDSPLLKVSF